MKLFVWLFFGVFIVMAKLMWFALKATWAILVFVGVALLLIPGNAGSAGAGAGRSAGRC